MKEIKKITLSEARLKIQHYCAYQERCHSETRTKLMGFGLSSEEADIQIVELIREGYLNEERFAKSYARGKFRMKQWGKIKITKHLEFKGVSKNCIQLGLKEIEENDYLDTLRNIMEKKLALLKKGDSPFAKREYLCQFALSRGFEPELAWEEVKKMLAP